MAMFRAVAAVAVLMCYISVPTSGYRILGLFPIPVASHFTFIHPVMRGLAEAGHNVTVISYFPDPKPLANYTDITLTEQEIPNNAIDLSVFKHFRKLGSFSGFINYYILYHFGTIMCNSALNSKVIQKIAETKGDYDVIMLEYFNSDCLQAVVWKLQIPVIGLSSSALLPWYYDSVGNPHHPAYIPSAFTAGSEQMPFFTRLINWWNIHSMTFLYRHLSGYSADKIVRNTLGEGIPPVNELLKNTSLIFVNQHYSLSGAKPLSPAVIDLGGIHIKDAKPLDQNLQKLIDTAEHGVIFVSWGSLIRASSLPEYTRDELMKAFASLKQVVIWKYENDTIPNKPNNVHIMKWLPQQDILCHANVRVFITHGGLGGSSEAAYCGVPVVITPMYGDQDMNAAALVSRGMGRILEFSDISKETMLNAIDYALQPETMENAKKVSLAYRKRIRTPKETAVWWVEYVIETKGAPFIKSYSTYMPAYSYYLLDVYFVVVVLVAISALFWVWALRWLCFRKKKNNKVKAN